MFFEIQNAVQAMWIMWCGLFKPLPYGDPYFAIIALFVVVAVCAKLIAGRETA